MNAWCIRALILKRQYHVGDVVIIENHQNKTVPIGIVTDRNLIV